MITIIISVENMTINGINLAERYDNGFKSYFVVNEVRGRGVQADELTLVDVPGMDGAYIDDGKLPPRPLEVDITLKGESFADLRKKIEDLNALLKTDNILEVTFADEPDRIYYGRLSAVTHKVEKQCVYQATLTLLCPDPYKYGAEKEVTFESSASFDVEGTVETEPIIEVTLNEDTEYVAVSNGEEINMVGFPAKQEEVVAPPETQIFKTSGENLIGWTNSSQESLGDAPMTGVLKSDGGTFYTDDYGNDPFHWHGPAMKTSLSQSLTDFRIDIGIKAQPTGANQAGSIEVALLDASNRMVTVLNMTKHFPGIDAIYGRVTAGGHDVIQEDWASYKWFEGVLQVYRRGNQWEAWIHAFNYGFSYIVHRWTDTTGVAAAPVTQVQVRLLQRGDMAVINQFVNDIIVYKINDLTANEVPIIGRLNDKFIFNHQNDIITKNGISVIDKKAFIGNYFKLQPGRNNIAVEPADKIQSVKVRWRDKWR